MRLYLGLRKFFEFRVASVQVTLTTVVCGPLKKLWRLKRKRNERTHSTKLRDKLLAIIRRCGFINPIIVGENDNVIAGHSILSV